jgi:hypothetical protein
LIEEALFIMDEGGTEAGRAKNEEKTNEETPKTTNEMM